MSKAAREKHRIKTIGKRGMTAWTQVPVTDEIRNAAPHMQFIQSVFTNNRLEVHCFSVKSSVGGIVHVVIARHLLLEPVANEEMQHVKNTLFGLNATAVEIYPPGVENLSHRARHLWVLPETWPLPFGFNSDTCWGGE